MNKGQQTRQMILEHAVNRASRLGLEGLSIGQLATELNLSKSGVFGHFRSKEDLQLQVLETVSQQFTESVIRPALKQARGVDRLRALFINWLNWAQAKNHERNGCPFMAAAMEFDDQEGPVREKLVAIQQQWIAILERTVSLGQEKGCFQQQLSAPQVVQEIYGLLLGFHLYQRLLRDPHAEQRTLNCFEDLLARLEAQGNAT